MILKLFVFALLFHCAHGVHIIMKNSQPPPHRNEVDLSSGKALHGVANSTTENYFYLPLDFESVLDVFLIRVSLHLNKAERLQNASTTHEGLQVFATNGHDSTSFTVPFVLPDGRLVYDVGRHLNPILPKSVRNDTSQPIQYLTIFIRTASHQNISFVLNWRRYDRAQYDIRFTKNNTSLQNQKVSFPAPWAARVTVPSSSEFASLKLLITSEDALCARVILANDDRNIYSATTFGTFAEAGIQEWRFGHRTEYSLKKEQLNEFLYIYVLVDADDKRCDSTAESRQPSKNKRIDFVVSMDNSGDYSISWIIVLVLLFLLILAPIFWIFRLSVRRRRRSQVAQDPESSNTSVTNESRVLYFSANQDGEGEASNATAEADIHEDEPELCLIDLSSSSPSSSNNILV